MYGSASANASPSYLPSRITADYELSQSFPSVSLFYEFSESVTHGVSSVVVRGRLHERLSVWSSMGASKFILKVLSDGYFFPLSLSLCQQSFQTNQVRLNITSLCLNPSTIC